MNHSLWQTELDAYVDGRLDPERATRFSEHLSGCTECQEELTALQDLVGMAKQLPRSLEPPRHIWSRIEENVTGRGSHEADDMEETRGLGAGWRAMLAAAALLAMFWIAAQMATPGSNRPGTPLLTTEAPPEKSAPGISVISDDGVRRPSSWAEVIWTLEEETLGAEKAFFTGFSSHPDPEALLRAGVVEPGLKALDAAIVETASAMRERPEDEQLARALAGYYERKLDLLRLATRLATET